MKIEIGDRFYSHYFKKWGIVSEFNNDNDWWFKLDKTHQYMKAKSKPEELMWENEYLKIRRNV